MNERPLVSVVIPSHNSSRTIRSTIQSLQNQTYDNIELIVVDKFSTDGTQDIVRRTAPDATVLAEGEERNPQKNAGARLAKGKYLYFVDSDFLVEPRVVSEAVAACENGYDGAIIHNTPDPTISFWAKVRKLEKDCYYRDPLHVAARFVSREVFFKVGGFDEAIIAGDDYEFHSRLLLFHAKLYWCASREYHLGEPKTLKEVVRKHLFYGENVLGYVQKEFAIRFWQLSPFRRSFVTNIGTFFDDPSLLAGFVFYQYVRYTSTIVGVLARRGPGKKPMALGLVALGGEEKGKLLSQVGIVVVTRNRPAQFLKCIDSLKPLAALGVELIVVDDDSNTSYVAKSEAVKSIRNDKRRYLNASRNKGSEEIKRPFILFVDDDNIVTEDAVAQMAKLLESYEKAAVACPIILSNNGRVWYAGGWVSPLSGLTVFAYRDYPPQLVPQRLVETKLFHSCFMVKKKAFDEAGRFDSYNFPMYLGEADLSERVRKLGYNVVLTPYARVIHDIDAGTLQSALRNVHITEPSRAYFVGRNRIIFMRRHRGKIRFFAFLLFVEPVIVIIHLSMIISGPKKYRWTQLAGPYLRGLFDGLSNRVNLGRAFLQDGRR